MLTLALDTTTRAGSVAVVRDATVLAVVLGDVTRTHGERLPGEFEAALQRAGVSLSELDLLAVASGPGAFTGLRIGLAAIQGLAMVLDVPVIAVSALDALAYCAGAGTVPPPGGQSPVPESLLAESLLPEESPLHVATWMDAARGEVFAARYSVAALSVPAATPARNCGASLLPNLAATSVPIVGAPQAVLDAMPAVPGTVFIGDGAVRYATQIQQHFGAGHRVEPPPPALAPYIAILGCAGAARGEAGPPHALQPLYVRRPDAEIARGSR
ncbi:MAG TPA: tRNA (adenosine(37)-N6)-threonylcarbamoyltransferase complex dimerization subunit type 1 TsaB [Gemmatimonadaceae bacterium]|nr:tRNA (adenosine(37)-N6)-threonylcarbamoyltransferase complex dimerization subunit type 1 TsaB [Gemmatimonadaceae bacterium]